MSLVRRALAALSMRAPLRSASIVGLSLLLGGVRLLGNGAARGALVAMVVAAGGGAFWSSCTETTGPLRVATFNVRRFGIEPTDVSRLASIVSSIEADVVALQEVQSEARLRSLEQKASGLRRRYKGVISRCGGQRGMQVGYLYDEARVRIDGVRELPELDPGGGGSCHDGDRAGLVATFTPVGGGEAVTALVVHLSAGGNDERASKRRAQWAKVVQIVDGLRREGRARVMVLGDVNSTGYLDNSFGERDFVQKLVKEHGLELPTGGLGCSEYWPQSQELMAPSLLDHVASAPGLVVSGSASVRGYCEALSCRPMKPGQMPRDYERVSDHCPVTVTLSPR